ncbi:hypothetical protein E2C01_044033 [Portunus trituberculatus]|uniref:Uncharacterized protein n=1 Tax=Portunus trituberculatus TaxID=210409 RepID=A0A5B7FQZ8_PORTR|nr:hypothetical protein [Portunus trituberculatus]
MIPTHSSTVCKGTSHYILYFYHIRKDVFNKVRRIAGKYSAPFKQVLGSATVRPADNKTVAKLFAEHFASVSRKDPAAPGARHRQSM